MGILDKIRGNPFEKLKKDDLTAEHIRLEREEKLKIAEVEKLSKQKKDLFDKGFDATEGERRSLARKIQQIDQKVKLDNIHLKKISDQIRVVDNMIFIHENKRMLENKGLMPKLARMDKSKLDEFLAGVNLKDHMMTDNFGVILTTMETEYGLQGEVEDDTEASKLMDLWSTSDIAEADEVYTKWDKEKVAKDREEELL
ncbi:MAG: hypothetical protein EMLJLAPB_01219 [Candidatus Argoarchaeum ethanivorans]|uniref:Uncharacterized protein n=1 Tax=Candidatus Argoarchaeum ethanivorans TaxID=2608793 RepID=A0A811TC74_9EURY|nr:MAG: hypothetical protein EMLJLAPB_01219 [Candidatus Argoarchaeum ethanivorans]